MKQHTIWQNLSLDLEDWREDILEWNPDATEDELYDIMVQTNWNYLDDERMNLNINVGSEIIGIADLGLWDGVHHGYRKIATGNIKDCLRMGDCDYGEFYVDSLGDLRFAGVHHDGRNNYLYRAYKPGVTSTQKSKLEDKILAGTATRRDITRVTRSLGDYIKEVYGWQ